MARAVGNTGIPTDSPVIERPGVMHREADFHGNAKWLALPPEDPERARKGDLGETIIPGLETEPLSHPGLPFFIDELGSSGVKG
jgi:hypothetical protein